MESLVDDHNPFSPDNFQNKTDKWKIKAKTWISYVAWTQV